MRLGIMSSFGRYQTCRMAAKMILLLSWFRKSNRNDCIYEWNKSLVYNHKYTQYYFDLNADSEIAITIYCL